MFFIMIKDALRSWAMSKYQLILTRRKVLAIWTRPQALDFVGMWSARAVFWYRGADRLPAAMMTPLYRP